MINVSPPVVSGDEVSVVGVAEQTFSHIKPTFGMTLCKAIPFTQHRFRIEGGHWGTRQLVSTYLSTNRLTVKAIYQLSTGINPPGELIEACRLDAEAVFAQVKFVLEQNDVPGNEQIQQPKKQRQGGRGGNQGRGQGNQRRSGRRW